MLAGLELDARDTRDSQTAESKAGLVSGVERVHGQQQLTNCRAVGGLAKWAWKGARDKKDSQAAEKPVLVSGLEMLGIAVTHQLQSRGWVRSAGLKGYQGQQRLTFCRVVGGLA